LLSVPQEGNPSACCRLVHGLLRARWLESAIGLFGLRKCPRAVFGTISHLSNITTFTRINQIFGKQIPSEICFVKTTSKLANQLHSWNISELFHISQIQ
jgi:hypothetical protein